MKLSYRGTSYQPLPHAVETIELETTCQFLGQTYQLRRPAYVPQHPLGLRKYRGVTYGN